MQTTLLAECFTKPDTENESMSSEYDKFFAQPMKMFAAAGILDENKVNRANSYHVREYEILKYISLSGEERTYILGHLSNQSDER